MNIIDIKQRSDEWRDYRKGKISGTRLSDLYAKRGGHKIGFYEMIADRLAIDPDEEDRMERGLRLEDEATELFTKQTGKKVVQVGLCVSDIHPSIINSPDGLIGKDGNYTEAIEIKCLSPARHLQAIIENKVPDDFTAQKIQYFIVNENLKTLHFIFYDPRILAKPFHVIEVEREDVAEQIDFFRDYELSIIEEIDGIVEKLAF